MKARPYLTLGLCFLLAGCGTLKINIDYGNTPTRKTAETPPDFAKTMDAIPA